MKKRTNNSNSKLNDVAKYANLGFEMLATILIGVIGGWQIDKYLGLGFPVATFVLTILAVILSIYRAIKDFI